MVGVAVGSGVLVGVVVGSTVGVAVGSGVLVGVVVGSALAVAAGAAMAAAAIGVAAIALCWCRSGVCWGGWRGWGAGALISHAASNATISTSDII